MTPAEGTAPGLTSLSLTGKAPALTGKAPALTLMVGGHMLPASSVRIEADAQSLPRAVITLPVADDVVVTLDGAVVMPDDRTREALVAMGWTPPPDTP